MTNKEAIYMVLDELKEFSDDSTFTEDHVLFLLNKNRALLLKQRYADIKKQMPDSNYQTICLCLEKYYPLEDACIGGVYLRSKEEIPYTMVIGSPRVYPLDFYKGEIAYISRDRMRYVGHNKYLKNIIYCSMGPDGHLYFKSSNPQHLYLRKVKFTAVFQDALEASKLGCDVSETNCDPLEWTFPIEDALVSTLIDMVVKELLGAVYRPKDPTNNADDDLSSIQSFIRQNMKSNLTKQLEGDA